MLYNKQFKWQDDLIHNVGLSFFKKDWVIKEIVYHPLKFAKRRMEDPNDDRPIRIRYFATFVMKMTKTKENIDKFKDIFRGYEKYKSIVESLGYAVDTEKNYKYDMKRLAFKNKWDIISEIYYKGSVINEP